jgi:MFS family permease
VSTFSVLPRARTRAAGASSPERLRAAVTALFLLNGSLFGTWAARVPDVAAQVSAGSTALGVALLVMALGALVAMRVTGALCARFGAGPVAAAAAVLVSVGAVLPGLASTVPMLSAALFVFGAGSGMIGVSSNALGVQLEVRMGRPLMSGLHAGFSFGGLFGALVGGAAASVLGVAPHLVLVAAAGLFLAGWALPALLAAEPEAAEAAPRSGTDGGGRGPVLTLAVLGTIAGCTSFGEGTLTDWGAILLREQLDAPSTLAAAGYAGFSLAMGLARLFGSRLVLAWGEARLLIGGTFVAAAGALAAVTTSSLWVALTGFVLVGLGLANVFPLAIARAGMLGGARGISLATTVGYTGMLGGPPLVGFLAEHAGLSVAVGSVAVLALLAGVLRSLVAGDRLRRPTPGAVARRATTEAGALLTPIALRVGRGADVYVRDLDLIRVP